MAQSRQHRPYELQAFMVQSGGIIAAEACVRLISECAVGLGKSPRFHGRRVNHEAADMSLALSWIKECAESHHCGKGVVAERAGVGDGLTLVDVKQDCLVEAPWDSKYIALSYVWPRVIADAMNVVLLLGQRFLWVDALCIVHDDGETAERLIKAMDQVYGRSFLIIVVASGSDPSHDYGISGINGLPRSIRQDSARVDGLDLVAALANYDKALRSSLWSTCGWIFQEGILSGRCLVFSEQQMYFRCGHDSRCEDVRAEGRGRFDKHAAKPIVRGGQLDYLGSDHFLRQVSSKNIWQEYALLVSGYTSRNLTFEEDVHNASKGIMQSLTSLLGPVGFFIGLPIGFFDATLLWYPTSRLRRRQAQTGDSRMSLLPTWSWMA
ncbi:heterokaryon incompatibility protein (HET) domain-containing protein [Hirsutella rhossiliensis]|uniref:Heterokaryon incompatibility protein (HET) domain-containing protein n=1 Tax=Hirsutella rhossiliensis TaxID=111463 RepID=A0A9P8N204_9HYPO|nr:heterokaryon incompatibility protein (HET) domain-containing protein [Hirsutella rhossiliensis]KAH0966773.1 heterokaryon incompatibility protein (HET) domain-containing protein [Hirsutella rhossiliensis]